MKPAFALFLMAVPALAQANPFVNVAPIDRMPSFTVTNAADSFVSVVQSNADTPTMQRQKLSRALALRAEAAALLEEDGGAFTPEHEAYVRRKAWRILNH